MSANQRGAGPVLSGPLLNFVGLVLGIAAAYFMTIQSLRIELAAKAEAVVVDALDRKLASIEVLLTEGVVSREQFYEFSKDVEARLIRIEDVLTREPGDNFGKR